MKETDAIKKFSHEINFEAIRIESHGTGNGIPDVFYQNFGVDFWAEFKNNQRASIENDNWHIDWRPGQVAWAWRYFLAHNREKCTLTILACHDGFVLIPMIDCEYSVNHSVCKKDAWVFRYNELKIMSTKTILMLINMLTNPFKVVVSSDTNVAHTCRTATVDFISKYYADDFDYDIDDLLSNVFEDIDVEKAFTSAEDKQMFRQHQQSIFRYLESFLF